jgi:hypothetical protein
MLVAFRNSIPAVKEILSWQMSLAETQNSCHLLQKLIIPELVKKSPAPFAYCRVQNIPPFVCVLMRMSPLYIFPPIAVRSFLILFSCLFLRLSRKSLSVG